MKINRISKGIILLIVMVMMSCTLLSCGSSEAEPVETGEVCYITIEDYCSEKEIKIHSGDTVYDILKKSEANVSARKNAYGMYIEGINGRFEFDEGPTSGWIYYVNDSKPNQSCDNYPVSGGDHINWDYVDKL